MVFQFINIRQVPLEVLKTAASGLGFQHLPRDLANINAWKTMFDPYIEGDLIYLVKFQPCCQWKQILLLPVSFAEHRVPSENRSSLNGMN